MKNLFDVILDENVKAIPNQPALIMDDEIITYLEFSKLVLRITSNIKEKGITPEHSVALRFKNPLSHFLFYFSLLKMRITQVSINPNDVLNMQNKVLSLIDNRVIIQDIPLSNSLIEETLYVDESYSLVSNQFKMQEPKKNNSYNEDIPAIIFYGSGTTSDPKIIAISRSILIKQIIIDSMMVEYKKSETFYINTELYYITSKRKITAALYNGMSIYLPRKKPENIISFCMQNGIEHLFLTTNQAVIMLSKKNNFKNASYPLLPKLKSFIISSSIVHEPLRKDIMSIITKNIYIAYGTNEVGQVTVASPEDIKAHPGTVGKVLPSITLRVVDNHAKDCSIGEIGNVLIKSLDMISEYSNNNEATKKTFTKDGYYAGDLGQLTEDGNLILEGREDDMMIFHGVNIYPRELESVLESHPNVIESAVFPLTINHKTGIPFAMVAVSEKIAEIELLKWCQEVSGWCRPQRIFFVKKLPRNSAGKILKRDLAKKIVEVMNS